MIRKKIILILIMFIGFTLIFSGCSGENDDKYESKYTSESNYYQKKQIQNSNNNIVPAKQKAPTNQRRIRTRYS